MNIFLTTDKDCVKKVRMRINIYLRVGL